MRPLYLKMGGLQAGVGVAVRAPVAFDLHFWNAL